MSEPLVSESWHRVASLRPSLVPGVRVLRQPVRGQVWHVLMEPASGRQLRLNPSAYALVGRFDGRMRMEELWERQLTQLREEAPTQDELLRLVSRLFRAGMVRFDAAPHLSLLFARRAEDGEQRRRGMLNPLALRMPLGDPARLLDALAPVGRAVFHPAALVVWCLAVLLGVLAAGAQGGELRADAERLLASPGNYLIAWLCYPLVKFVHELGHGLAVRRFGGEVHEVGLSLMLLTPAPYVDASAANAFPSARHRFVVSAAGILVETALACAALAAWTLLAPGVVRDTALVVILICSVSTVLFNANPLVRLDGYYALTDALQLPNLALRSQAWWARRWRALLKAREPGAVPLLVPGEAKWLAGYAPAALVYRIVLMLTLVLWVGSHSWMLGWAAGLVLLALGLRAAWRWLSASSQGDPHLQARSVRLVGGLCAGVLVVLFAIPAPDAVVARGIVWPPDNAQLRAGAAGFVERLELPQGARAAAGQSLVVLSDPTLVASRERIASERTGLLAQQYAALLSQPARAMEIAEDLERNAAELARVDEQLAQLELRAQVDGDVVWARPQDLPGSYVKRGAMLGHVLAGGPAHVRIALLEEDFVRARGEVRSVAVRVAAEPHVVHAAQLSPATPGATLELPAASLGDRQGGPVPVDPADASGLRARVPVLLLDATVPTLDASAIGGRAWVKLQLPARPLGLQWLARVRQILIKQFNPTGQA